MEQVGWRGERYAEPSFARLMRIEIRPIGRDERAAAVGQHEDQMQAIAPMGPAENAE